MSKHAHVKPYPKEFRDQVVKSVQLGNCSTLEVDKALDAEVYFARPYRSVTTVRTSMPTGSCARTLANPRAREARPRKVLRLPHRPGGLLADRLGLGHLGRLTASRRPGSARGTFLPRNGPVPAPETLFA